MCVCVFPNGDGFSCHLSKFTSGRYHVSFLKSFHKDLIALIKSRQLMNIEFIF